MLAPVKPILELKRDDDRFVESKEVLDQLRPEDNLAAIEWEDFEHLVRELFEKEFAQSGGEVRVTQASRDRGVDAIAFDPDPIRGGKFVIQAKRYNMVVPVSAVRDLYGTMIAEGATKGILVTTSHYGRDSREFAKDKPITLIDGENLVHMFQKHGRNVHIAMLPKGDPRRGLGSVAG
jgi:restriction system protein